MPVEEARKLRYEDIREGLLLDYKTKGNKGLEEDQDGDAYIWGLNHTDEFFRNKRVRSIKTNTLYQFICEEAGGRSCKCYHQPLSRASETCDEHRQARWQTGFRPILPHAQGGQRPHRIHKP